MSASVVVPGVAVAPLNVATPVKRWLVGPWFDLVFLANLAWPLAALVYLSRLFQQANTLEPLAQDEAIILFQVYFISTPHRWITLVLVFCDSDRFWKEPAKFGSVALGLIALGLGLVFVTGFLPYAASSLMLLMMVDYVWNAWHFAAQHAGISRIYGRMARPDQTAEHGEFEKMAVRILVLWVFCRFAIYLGTRSQYAANVEWINPWLHWIDPFVYIPAIIFFAREIAAFRWASVGRLCYLASVFALYSSQLIAIRLEDTSLLMAFFFAGAIFHAVEYLAICNWSVQKRTTGIWRYQITRTGIAVAVFMALLGAANWLVNAQSVYAWQLITLLVSLLHYGYDGMIWRAKPAK
jgi:hypothetical protein